MSSLCPFSILFAIVLVVELAIDLVDVRIFSFTERSGYTVQATREIDCAFSTLQCERILNSSALK